MFRTGKVESGKVTVTHESDLVVTIEVKDSIVINVDVDMSNVGAEILAHEDEVYNTIVGAFIPRLISDGVL